MPRGKNYANNNRGVFLKSSGKKKSPAMESCYYGANCTRKDCIYRHDTKPGKSNPEKAQKSTEPCMAFLAGICKFNSESCRKRHPSSDQERKEWIAQFQRMPCRYGVHCKTSGCLFQHPSPATQSFPPLPGATSVQCVPVASAWRAAPPPAYSMAPPPPPPQVAVPPQPMMHATGVQSSPNNLNINAKEFVPGGGAGW